jgi:hypothetical protein
MPLKLASWKEKDIVKSTIEWMEISDVLKGRAIPAVENDVTCALWLITITWKNDGDLIIGGIWQIVAMTVTTLVKAQSNLALLLWRHVSGELTGLLVHLNSRMAAVEHVLEGDQSVVIKVGVPGIGHAKVGGISRIIDVELSIYRRLTIRWKERTGLVG